MPRYISDLVQDWVFLSIDTLGGLFSLFALGKVVPDFWHLDKLTSNDFLAAQGSFDILGGVMYIVV